MPQIRRWNSRSNYMTHPKLVSCIISFIGLGTLVVFISSNWLLAWVGLEINTLAILPLIAKLPHPRKVEGALKYFIVQETAAAVVLFSATINAWFTGEWGFQHISEPITTHMCFLALAFKVGLAPLHMWLPDVLQGQDFATGLILTTWQKLAPFALLVQLACELTSLSVIIGLTSIFVGAWGGLNQTQVRKLLAYSSIAHIGWMILVIEYQPSLTILTLILYILITASLFIIFMLGKSKTLNQLATGWAKNPLLTVLAPLVILSLAGLPPLTGFIPKWIILSEIALNGLALTGGLAVLGTLLSLFFYLRVVYCFGVTFPPGQPTDLPWRHDLTWPALPLATFTVLSIFLLPVLSFIIAAYSY